MNKDSWLGIVIILGIILIGLYGGGTNPNGKGPFSFSTTTQVSEEQKRYELEQKILETEREVEELRKKVEEEELKKYESKYKGQIVISYVSRSTDPKYEYVSISSRNVPLSGIKVSGWVLKGSNSQSIPIPKASYLYFADTENVEEDIILKSNENLYLITSYSPNGASFKLNKCSGYLSQFQNFIPSLNYSCPAPRNEDLSSIPKTRNNYACLDYINSMPSCRIQTESIPQSWSYECANFIYNKINYPSCVNAHKNDRDFYGNEWRVYLKRTESIWMPNRETVTLYDEEGKIVSTINY